MKSILAPIKFGLVVSVIITYFIVTAPIYPFLKFYPFATKRLLARICGFFASMILAIVNVKFEVQGEENILPHKNYFIVCNHLSYLDMMMISSVIPTSYVTSIEIKETPVLGQLAQLSGCLFVERRNKKNIMSEIQEIETALKNGVNVTVFPEATSTNGEQVLGFKRSLFQSAVNVGVEVLPLTINYKTIDGKALNRQNRDKVCWYGDMSFAPHLWELCKSAEVTASLSVSSHVEVAGKIECSALLRDICYQNVSENYSVLV